MPSKSKAQRNLMAAAAHNPAFAKKVGVPVAVAQEFNKADKGKKFGSGGMAKSDMKEDTKMDMAQDKAMIKKAFKQHDAQEHKGAKGTKLSLKKGGMCGGGMSKKYASGGKVSQLSKANGIAVRGKTKGTIC
jgi:phage tail sheath gpL-like